MLTQGSQHGDGPNAYGPRTRALREGGTLLGRRLLAGALLTAALVLAGPGGALAGGAAPTVETEGVRELARTSAVLTAAVNPNGTTVTECDFEYGTSESSLPDRAPCSYSPGSLETPVPVLAKVEGLPETTTYYFRIHAKSSAGESSGEVLSFTTLPTAPRSHTEAANPIGDTTATLNGYVTPDGLEVTECYFEYGSVESDLDETVPCSPAEPGAGSEPVPVKAAIKGLSESTVYYFRVLARNALGLESSGRNSFETRPSVPRANTEPAREVARTEATLRGFVTPHGAAVERCYFQWGAHSVEEHTAECEPAAAELGAGEEPEPVSARLTGLKEGETYSFRLVAANARGSDTGGGLHFTTEPHDPRVVMGTPLEVTGESANFKGSVNPEGHAVTLCQFEYGPTPALGGTVPCSAVSGEGESYVKVFARATGLSPTTAYIARIRVANAAGTIYSGEERFTTGTGTHLPVVSSLRLDKGSSAGGTEVTVKGEYLSEATTVTFGEAEVHVIKADTGKTLTVITPPGVGTVDVTVTTPSGESAVNSGATFTYGDPTITAVDPSSGSVAGGYEATIKGSGFEAFGSTFTFGKVTATTLECPSSLECVVLVPPAYKGKAATVAVTARSAGKKSKKSAGDLFSYVAG